MLCSLAGFDPTGQSGPSPGPFEHEPSDSPHPAGPPAMNGNAPGPPFIPPGMPCFALHWSNQGLLSVRPYNSKTTVSALSIIKQGFVKPYPHNYPICLQAQTQMNVAVQPPGVSASVIMQK